MKAVWLIFREASVDNSCLTENEPYGLFFGRKMSHIWTKTVDCFLEKCRLTENEPYENTV